MRPSIENEGTLAIERSRVLDYLSLTKPELTLLSVMTTLGGFYLGAGGMGHGLQLLHTLMGTACVGGAAGALNQFIERRYDAMMRRTEHRPLPSGRLAPVEALLFGIVLAVFGILQLLVFVNTLTASLSAVTLVSYLFVYTPLKRITPASTLVGALPGAIPPLMGWTAATGGFSVEGWILFSILFFWQMPHFLSLAWMYRRDYARAGYRLLTAADETGRRTGTHVAMYTAILIPVSLLPVFLGYAGWIYGVAAGLSGLAFLAAAFQLFMQRSNNAARRLFGASLAYLPVVFLFLVIDKF